MHKTICLAGAAVLALAVPGVSLAQNNGRGHDNHAGKDHGGGHEDRGRGQDNRGHGGQGQDNRGNDHRGGPPGQQARGHDNDRGRERDVRVVTGGRDHDRGRTTVVADGRPVLVGPREADRGLIAGCPPGLARKNNGCLPPGQARRIERAHYDYLWARRNDGYVYRYDDGYVYRLSPQGSLLGYLPVLGGALGLGNPWPAQYAFEPAPRYYVDYYRLNDRYNYRYADGVLYGLDPQTQAIGQVAALLTGQQWAVGQAMPAGYDIYNVPYAYRDQYIDGPERLYRYNDGYVYQVDPTTRLVQAVIQLLV